MPDHRMWKIVPPFTDSLSVLKAYTTPLLREEIAPGDAAYIFCTVDNEGIVAEGVVAEAPRWLTATNAATFADPTSARSPPNSSSPRPP